ncbi:hypothetical protein HDU85_006867 [Gaertneriomyces sp. JEL0708]|nr:hypothetical protein HDU85_006867 [Gaertneriomyces sp. JEL0708]
MSPATSYKAIASTSATRGTSDTRGRGRGRFPYGPCYQQPYPQGLQINPMEVDSYQHYEYDYKYDDQHYEEHVAELEMTDQIQEILEGPTPTTRTRSSNENSVNYMDFQ